jgi:hypothetical protein
MILHDPPQWRPVVATGYTFALLMGVVTIIAPPRTIETQLGDTLATVWGVLLTIGGIGGLAFVYTRWWWAERLSIAVIWMGLGMYGFIVGLLAFTETGNRWTQLGALALAFCFFLLRFLQIIGWDYRPPIYDDRE